MALVRTTLLAAILLTAATARGASYYVAKNGSDANPGSETRPFQTIGRAIKAAGPGSEVVVRGGLYRELVTIWSKRGSRAKPLIVRAYPGDHPIIDGQGLKPKNALVEIGESQWVTFDGFEVRNSSRAGILLWSVKNSTIRRNTIHDCMKGGIHASGDHWGDTAYVVIDRNVIHHTVLENRSRRASQWSQALGIEQSQHVAITSNWVYKNFGEGVDYIGSDHGTIRRNRVWDNFSTNVYLDNAQTTTVDANLIYSSSDKVFYRDGSPATGIMAANERYRRQNPLTDLVITNNIVLWTRAAFYYRNAEYGRGLHRTIIANNTFYSATWALVVIDGAMLSLHLHDTTTVANNIFYQRRNLPYTEGTSRGITYRNNLWFGGAAGSRVRSDDDVDGDPKLVSAGGGKAEQYMLQPGSPAIDRGAPLSVVTRDYFEKARTARPDLGASER